MIGICKNLDIFIAHPSMISRSNTQTTWLNILYTLLFRAAAGWGDLLCALLVEPSSRNPTINTPQNPALFFCWLVLRSLYLHCLYAGPLPVF
ncbi:MAG: hypothetical protein C3F13_19325 [Anaerolineales bacterium]|nr:MAG: hypothetical protein C3F13_19325 [Anaerolineales bacterium]